MTFPKSVIHTSLLLEQSKQYPTESLESWGVGNDETQNSPNLKVSPLSNTAQSSAFVEGSDERMASAVHLFAKILARHPLKLFKALQWSICSWVTNIASMSARDAPLPFRYASILRIPTPASIRIFLP